MNHCCSKECKDHKEHGKVFKKCDSSNNISNSNSSNDTVCSTSTMDQKIVPSNVFARQRSFQEQKEYKQKLMKQKYLLEKQNQADVVLQSSSNNNGNVDDDNNSRGTNIISNNNAAISNKHVQVDQILTAVSDYCERYSTRESSMLTDIRNDTLLLYPNQPTITRMLCSSLQAQLLNMITQLIQPKSI